MGRKMISKYRQGGSYLQNERAKVYMQLFLPYFRGQPLPAMIDGLGMALASFARFVPEGEQIRILREVKAYVLSRSLERQDHEKSKGGDKIVKGD